MAKELVPKEVVWDDNALFEKFRSIQETKISDRIIPQKLLAQIQFGISKEKIAKSYDISEEQLEFYLQDTLKKTFRQVREVSEVEMQTYLIQLAIEHAKINPTVLMKMLEKYCDWEKSTDNKERTVINVSIDKLLQTIDQDVALMPETREELKQRAIADYKKENLLPSHGLDGQNNAQEAQGDEFRTRVEQSKDP